MNNDQLLLKKVEDAVQGNPLEDVVAACGATAASASIGLGESEEDFLGMMGVAFRAIRDARREDIRLVPNDEKGT